MERDGEHIIHLEVGEPDFETPKKILQAGIAALERGETHYTHSLGIFQLREAIAQNYSKNYLTEIKKIAASIPRKDEALLVICVKYYRFKRQFPALKGRATLFIPDLKILINEVSYFEKDGKRWIRLPTYHSGHVGSDTGKPVYKSYFLFYIVGQ